MREFIKYNQYGFYFFGWRFCSDAQFQKLKLDFQNANIGTSWLYNSWTYFPRLNAHLFWSKRGN